MHALPGRGRHAAVRGLALAISLGSLLAVPGAGIALASEIGAGVEEGDVGFTPAPGRQANYAFDIDAPEDIAERIRELSFVGRWQYREDFLPTQMPALLARLDDEVMGILRSLGYYSGKVRSRGDADRVEVRVAPGPRVTVALSEVRIEGPAAEDRRVGRFVRSRWLLPEGSFFASREWERGKRGLVDALHQRGYLRARITGSEARVDPELSSAQLEVVLDSGPLIAFGELEIQGLRRHDESIVRDLRPFRPGDPYSLEKLLAYEAALRDSGYFSGVSVVPDLAPLEADPDLLEVPLSVDLAEYRAKRAVFGIGYSSEQGARGQVGFEHRDLFGRSWQLESSLIAEARRQRLFANVRTPTEATGHFYGFGGRLEKVDAAGERAQRSNVYFGRGKRTAEIEWFLSLQMQAEDRRLDGNESYAAIEDSAHALVLGYSWNLRRLNSRVLPRRGYTISTQVSGAAKGVASNRSFVRFYGRAMRFVPMPRQSFLAGGTLVALGEFGVVAAGSRRDIPSENLFRAGGSHSVRGYGYQTLGVPEAGAIVGGRYLAVGSLEYQHPVTESIAAAIFYDIGNATDSRQDYKAVAGYGVGMRWRTPVGPLNLDLAYGEAVSRWRLHFSVGYTF
ncbi:MAG: autotransporter assembly complex protein TamA [Pseudomonadota bacterium]|nr:autotransporter assembly complex protein TamA [Pseudomonadota bacterium]